MGTGIPFVNQNTYKCIAVVQVFNELDKGNLERYFRYMRPHVDKIIVYDDFSADGTYEYCLSHADIVMRGTKNEFKKEIFHKQKLLTRALAFEPDFIFSLDADEIFTDNARFELQKLLHQCVVNDFDGIQLSEINLWRSSHWKRTDSLFNEGKFVRIWRCKPGIKFENIKQGLHQQHFPTTLKKIMKVNDISLLHFGFADERNIAFKYLTYKAHGQKGYDDLERLIDETRLTLEKVEPKLLPSEIRDVSDQMPVKKSYSDAMSYVLQNKKKFRQPKFSFVCLIYKSTGWLDFIYTQLLKYTPLDDSEIIFIANDADEDVLSYLSDNYLTHVAFRNTDQQRQEWYINNVYRAFNHAGEIAKGEYLIFVNSDMAFSPSWFECLLASYDGTSVLSPRGVESGKYDAGVNGISKNFGRHYKHYQEEDFLNFAHLIKEQKTKAGGIFMPLLIRKDIFNEVGRYPEGNILPNSDLHSPVIAEKGQDVIPGDVVLMKKLERKGIFHKTAFNSVIYHFQCGESENEKVSDNKATQIAICNDICGGTMGERVLWNDLVDNLPGAYPVDKSIVGSLNFEAKAREYIEDKGVNLVIQNASFISFVNTESLSIVYLQDDLRAMGKQSLQQERNLKLADVIVTNSLQTSLSYEEFEMEFIPVGVDEELFQPKNRQEMRAKHGIPDVFTGIFVGSLNNVKGWPKIRQFIEGHPEMHFIVVTKHDETFDSENISFYSRIPQKILSELLNCADFFFIGSPVETQCLAAIEANLCGLPVMMPLVGVYKEFSEEERGNLGIFTDNFDSGIKEIVAFKGQPRQQIIDRGLTKEATIACWRSLIEKTLQKERQARLQGSHIKIRKQRNEFLINVEQFIRMKLFKPLFGTRYLNLRDKLSRRFARKIVISVLKAAGLYTFLKSVRDGIKTRI